MKKENDYNWGGTTKNSTMYLDIWRRYYNKELRVYVQPENGYLGIEIGISFKRVPENLKSNWNGLYLVLGVCYTGRYNWQKLLNFT